MSRTAVRMVCLGTRARNSHVKKNRLAVQTWAVLDVEGVPGPEMAFGYDAIKVARPGSIYSVEVERDEQDKISIFASTAQFVGVYHDDAKRVEWLALHEAAETVVRMWKRENTANHRNDLMECLAPIKEAMKQTDTRGRRAILVQVIEYLEGR